MNVNNDTSNAFKLGQEIDLTRASLFAADEKVRHTKLAMHIFFFTTWILYFIFALGMYAADLWGITTWLSANTSELVAFSIFLLLALGMATGLSIFKHVFYEHRAEFAFGIGAVVIVAAVGIFFEAINSSSQQQNIAYGKAETSKGYDSVAGTTITVGGQGDVGQLAAYQGELARYKSLNATCKKNCTTTRAKVAEFTAKVQSAKDSNAAAAASISNATSSAIKAKAEALQTMKDEQHKPIFKSVRDIFGVTIASAIMIITLIVSGAFEYCHALLSRILGEKLRLLADLRNTLIKQTTEYMRLTGKQYDNADFDGLEGNLHQHDPVQREQTAQQGFGIIPQRQSTAASTALFKYQQTPPPAPSARGFGFLGNREKLDAPDKPEMKAAGFKQSPAQREVVEKLYADQLADYAAGKTYRDIPQNPTAPALPHDQKNGHTGLQNPVLGRAEKQHELDLSHGTSPVERSTVSHGTSPVEADENGRVLDDVLYAELKRKIVAREVEPMGRSVKPLLKIWQVGRNDEHRQHIAAAALERMNREGVLLLNPEQGKFKRKYLLA
jgi:hypothetical protein